MTIRQPRPPLPSAAPPAQANRGPDLPPDARGQTVNDRAPGQDSAQPHPVPNVTGPDSNTSVAGEEDPGAALDVAPVGAEDATTRPSGAATQAGPPHLARTVYGAVQTQTACSLILSNSPSP